MAEPQPTQVEIVPARAPIVLKDDQRRQLQYVFKISGMDTQQQQKMVDNLKILFNVV